jgi:hypothetical protein
VTAGKVYIQEFPFGPFSQVNLISGELVAQTDVACGGLSSTTVGAGGVAYGSKSDKSIVQVDPVSGRCKIEFTAPEWIANLAIAPDGTFVGQSQASTFGARQIYRFSSSGDVLSVVPLSGVSSLGGFAYAPNGKLYGPGMFGWFELDPITGIAQPVGPSTQIPLSQICIDSAGLAYGHSFGVLYQYLATTGAPIGSLTLQRDLGLAPIICR